MLIKDDNQDFNQLENCGEIKEVDDEWFKNLDSSKKCIIDKKVCNEDKSVDLISTTSQLLEKSAVDKLKLPEDKTKISTQPGTTPAHEEKDQPTPSQRA